MSAVGRQEEMKADAQLTFSIIKNGTLANEVVLPATKGWERYFHTNELNLWTPLKMCSEACLLDNSRVYSSNGSGTWESGADKWGSLYSHVVAGFT